ncbi:hypothetical protein MNV49_003910 [Pseudohyphozyma bogoriensis]|nr:hypothetical protein MNV49_003910 [Pseudohyphozyma bogoriensis]
MITISPGASLLLSTGYTTAYLSAIYLLPQTRVDLAPPAPPPAPRPPTPDDGTAPTDPIASTPRDRNHPEIIRARLLAVSVSTALSCASLALLPTSPASPSIPTLLGLTLPSAPKQLLNLVALPLGLTATLFAGSLYIIGLRGGLPGQKWWSWRGAVRDFGGWQGVRNYIVGPLTEELVFRSCIIAVSKLAGMSKSQMIFLTPLYFGIAHVHHAWETYVAGGRTSQSLKKGVLQSTFQFAYTTLFGWYASFIFMRTGSILPAFFVHSFCNAMGLPPLGWALYAFPQKKLSLWGSYVAGIAGFIYGFWRWTEPAFFGGSLYWP